jgi:hypothetical protein
MARKKIPAAALEFFRRAGARGGKIGTKMRMEKLTPEQRSEFARSAALARWAKKRTNTQKTASNP